MRRPALSVLATFALLAACSTPYNSPVVVRDSAAFPGVANVIVQDRSQPVDVVMVHGMCTHDASWALATMRQVADAVGARVVQEPPLAGAAASPRIEVVQRSHQVGGATLRFNAFLWSPVVAELKQQLAFDRTGTPTDCASDAECKPKRAYLNARLKDELLNDCLADAMIYEGRSQPVIRKAVVESVARVFEQAEQRAGNNPGPLVVVSESLGSKILFDALSDMLQPEAPPRLRELGQRAARRMAIIFMLGNQLPVLGLASQDITPAPPEDQLQNFPATDSLQRFLALRRMQERAPQGGGISKLAVVAFTDPNDSLSYRLLPSRYAGPDVLVADVLVSNDMTWFGLLENPFTAHLGYLKNPAVGDMIACGWPRSPACK